MSAPIIEEYVFPTIYGTVSKVSSLEEKLEIALRLLKSAECTGDTYVDISKRSQWRKERDQLLNDTQNDS